MGWEPVTTYVHDANGVLLSSSPEVEYDDVERDWMLALAHYRDEVLCSRCGFPKEVCRAQATGMPGAAFAESERCHVTAAISSAQKRDVDAGVAHMDSLMYSAGVNAP